MTDEISIQLIVTAEPGAPRVSLNIPKSITAAKLREIASESTKIPLAAIKLIFRGRLIASDDSKLAVDEYKLEEGSALHCMGKPVLSDDSSAPSDSAATASSVLVPSSLVGSTVSISAASASAAASASSSLSSDPLLLALQNMRATNSPADYQTAVQVLDKLLANIIAHPLENKYRRVKKENPAFQRRLGGVPGGEAVLLAAGFVSGKDDKDEAADVYMMQASEDAWTRLLAVKEKVARAVREIDAARATNLPTAATGVGALNPFSMPSMVGGGGMPADLMGMGSGGMPPEMNRLISGMMSDPTAMQNMLRVSKHA
jgi:hypothetical protein